MVRTLLRLAALGGVAIIMIVLVPLVAVGAHSHTQVQSASTQFTIVATGLNNPRGLTFGLDGNLYVAEGGLSHELRNEIEFVAGSHKMCLL